MLFFIPDILQFYLKIIYSHFIRSGTIEVGEGNVVVVEGFVLLAVYDYFFIVYPPVLLIVLLN